MHPIWCTPPVRFVDLKLEMDEAELKKEVEGHEVDVADEVVVLVADAGVVMDEEIGVPFVVAKEIADGVNDDFDAASDDDLEEVEAEEFDLADAVVEVVEMVAADDETAYLVSDVVAGLIVVAVVAAGLVAVDFVAFD